MIWRIPVHGPAIARVTEPEAVLARTGGGPLKAG